MRIGILGAGQLGRMLALEGYPLGHSFLLYDFNGTACPGAGELIVDRDRLQLDAFLNEVDCVTFEFEHIPLDLVESVNRKIDVFPNVEALALGKDRAQEKNMFVALNIPTTRFFVASTYEDLSRAVESLGGKAVIKTATGGYDGKGQSVVLSPDDVQMAWKKLGGQRLIVEELIDFNAEISVIACRSRSGEVCFYSPTENIHKDGILRFSIAPAPMLNSHLAQQAQSHIQKILEYLDYVGTLALELFVCERGLVANEIATRVHNSGHWTLDGAVTSQFENHIRAIAGQPLGSTEPTGVSCMMNVIGEYGDFATFLRIPHAHCYHYGKHEYSGRKLAHVNIVASSFDELYKLAAEWFRATPHFDLLTSALQGDGVRMVTNSSAVVG